ncbi:MAG: anti-sigma B factor antagonist [Lentimonas sp.]|jgi:anti-sigma B factor antagonist
MIITTVTPRGLEVSFDVESLDAANAAEVKATLKGLDLQGQSHVVLNLQKVEFIDSSGIGAILSFYKEMEHRVSLRHPSPTVLSVLELLRLHTIFEIESE